MSGPRRRLAPWEEIVYFNDPKATITVLALNSWTQIAPANPQRIALLISTNGTSSFVTTDPTISTTTDGIPIGTAIAPLFFHEATDGTLCTAAWYGRGSTGTHIMATEVILRVWPEGEQ